MGDGGFCYSFVAKLSGVGEPLTVGFFLYGKDVCGSALEMCPGTIL